jgi:hypothetical protein
VEPVLEPGEHLLACAVVGSNDSEVGVFDRIPKLETQWLEWLDR